MQFTEDIDHLLNESFSTEHTVQAKASETVILYGAGLYGKAAYNYFMSLNKKVLCFIDDNKEGTFLGLPVYKTGKSIVSKQEQRGITVIITFSLKDEAVYKRVAEHLCAFGYAEQNIKPWPAFFENDAGTERQLQENRQKILQAAALFQEEESQAVWKGCLEAKLKRDLSFYRIPSDRLQYFDQDIPFTKGFKRMIDCGACDGDTYRIIRDNGIVMEEYAAFEPNPAFFKGLSAQCRSGMSAKRRHYLFPCGAYDTHAMMSFDVIDVDHGCRIDEAGKDYIVCVAIDDVLPDFAPTFLKMDIEGSEYRALLGAKRTIQAYRPDLAICLYHKTCDLWELPNLIHSFCPGYRFYARSYYLYGAETVLYACYDMEGK